MPSSVLQALSVNCAHAEPCYEERTFIASESSDLHPLFLPLGKRRAASLAVSYSEASSCRPEQNELGHGGTASEAKKGERGDGEGVGLSHCAAASCALNDRRTRRDAGETRAQRSEPLVRFASLPPGLLLYGTCGRRNTSDRLYAILSALLPPTHPTRASCSAMRPVTASRGARSRRARSPFPADDASQHNNEREGRQQPQRTASRNFATLTWSFRPFRLRVLRTKSRASDCAGAGSSGRN